MRRRRHNEVVPAILLLACLAAITTQSLPRTPAEEETQGIGILLDKQEASRPPYEEDEQVSLFVDEPSVTENINNATLAPSDNKTLVAENE